MSNRNIHCLLIGCYICLISGCISNNNDSSSADTTASQIDLKPIVTQATDSFPIKIRLGVQWSRDTDTSRSYTLMSSLGSKPLGMVVILPEKSNRVITGKGYFITLGAPSDLLAHLFATEYKVPVTTTATFPDTIPFTSINAQDTNIAAQYKLIFASPDSTAGPELYMDIDPNEQWLEFTEKDTTDRKPLIGILTRH